MPPSSPLRASRRCRRQGCRLAMAGAPMGLGGGRGRWAGCLPSPIPGPSEHTHVGVHRAAEPAWRRAAVQQPEYAGAVRGVPGDPGRRGAAAGWARAGNVTAIASPLPVYRCGAWRIAGSGALAARGAAALGAATAAATGDGAVASVAGGPAPRLGVRRATGAPTWSAPAPPHAWRPVVGRGAPPLPGLWHVALGVLPAAVASRVLPLTSSSVTGTLNEMARSVNRSALARLAR
jgi:hypothetical protein